jgi:hypothetical protein
MTTPQIHIYDVLTGETIVRDLNSLELQELEDQRIKAAQEAGALATAQADKAATRAAVMTRLGLTSDELLALLS